MYLFYSEIFLLSYPSKKNNLQDLEVSVMILHDYHNKISSVFGTKILPYQDLARFYSKIIE